MMEKLVTAIILISCVITSHLVIAKTPIHSVLAPAENITNYETISPTIIYQSVETTHGNPHDLWIKFVMPNETFELRLTMNKNLFSPRYTGMSIEDGKVVLKKGHKNCFYHGTVVGFANWTVAMSTCTGLRGTFGDHEDFSTLYHIEPLRRTSDEIEQLHIVYGLSELSVDNRNRTCGCNNSHRAALHHDFTVPIDRVRRQSVRRIVEWFVFNDRRQFIAQGRNLRQTEQRSIEIANVVDMLFAKIGIRVSLVGMETWNRRDLIRVTSNSHILLGDFISHLWSRRERFDSAMLITSIDFNDQVLGVARLGTMCRGRSAAGLTQDTGSSVAYVASIAAHELGHIFGMEHDDGRGCTCTGTNNRCIMAASASWPPPVEWSGCSVSDLRAGFARGLGRCLLTEAALISQGVECGNGIREGDEECDCGTPALCDDPCCNPNTCQLVDGADCSSREPCCSECQFKASGTVCRSAFGECDIPEYCNGTSGECPVDLYQQNGAECASRKAYCSNGVCQDLNAMCNNSFAPRNRMPSTVGPQKCFNFNTAGTKYGNCGHNSRAFLACAAADVRCGQLHCQNSGDLRLSVGADVTVSTRKAIVSGRKTVKCRSFTTQPGSDIVLGLVPEGAKCGTNRLCRDQRCIRRQPIPCPSANSRECSGNGICNNLDQCSCNPGFTGSNCNSTVTGVRDPHRKNHMQLK